MISIELYLRSNQPLTTETTHTGKKYHLQNISHTYKIFQILPCKVRWYSTINADRPPPFSALHHRGPRYNHV